VKRKLFSSIIILLLVLPLHGSFSNAETFTVKRVIDGDTLLLTTRERVRLMGVDTPETKHPEKPVKI
jgi:micrococcal nuclease